jgi:hypothetical protein
MHNVLEEERALAKVSYFFVHDLYRAAWDLNNKLKALLDESKRNAKEQDFGERADAQLNKLQALYDTVAVLHDMKKLTGGGFPWDWGHKAMRETWPDNLGQEHLETIASSCQRTFLQTISEYVPEMKQKRCRILIREVSDSFEVISEVEASAIPDQSESRPLPPLDTTGAPHSRRAIMAPLVELTRNAINAIIRDGNDYASYTAKLGCAHLDYQIRIDDTDRSVHVIIWNPSLSDHAPVAGSLEDIRNLLFNHAVEISTPVVVDHGPDGNCHWLRSEFIYYPARIRFDREKHA